MYHQLNEENFFQPPNKLPANVSTDGRCGPSFGNKVCQGKACCSKFGWCGGQQGTSSDWCSDGQEGTGDGKYDGKPILQPTPLITDKSNPPTYIGGNVYNTREQASNACKSYGYERLSTTDEMRGWENCAEGWTSDGRGWWMGPKVPRSGCGVANSWNKSSQQTSGAYCLWEKNRYYCPSNRMHKTKPTWIIGESQC